MGFRDYIRLAEKDKMETMLEENPSFYYDILPYAQVLGVSDIWTDKFAGLSMQPPYWAMNTHVSLFDVYVIHSLLRSTSGDFVAFLPFAPAGRERQRRRFRRRRFRRRRGRRASAVVASEAAADAVFNR